MVRPLNKVIGSTVASGLAVAFSDVFVWALSQWGVIVPPSIGSAFTVIFTAAVTLAAGYLVPLSAQEQQDVADTHLNRRLRATAVERASGRVGRDNTR